MFKFSDWRESPTIDLFALLAWVVLRDADRVQYVLASDAAGALVITSLETAKAPRLELGNAIEEVIRRLACGELSCTGRRVGVDGQHGPRVPVDGREWQSVEMNLATGGAEDNSAGITFSALLFPTNRVMEIWPARPSATPIASATSAEDQSHARLVEIMKSGAPRKGYSKGELKTALTYEIDGLSDRGFDRARGRALREAGIDERWGKSGRLPDALDAGK